MPRYRLRVPEPGTFLYGDGDTSLVADTIEQAREIYRDERDEPAIYLHSQIGSCQIVYKRDVDACDCHEDAEPGDTTVWLGPDDGRELASNECRVWILGPPHWPWKYDYLEPIAVSWRDIPVGAQARHAVLGQGIVCAPPRTWRASGKPLFPIRFESGERRDLFLGQIALFHCAAFPPPPRLVRVWVAGEVVTDGVTEHAASELVDLRTARLNAEWEAEQFALYESTREAVMA